MTDVVGKPEFAVVGDAFRFQWDCGIEADVERIAEHRDELTAEITIHSRRPPTPGLVHSARVNLMSTQTRATLVRALNERGPGLDWAAIVEQLCILSREYYRSGEPSIDMRFYERTAGSRWLVAPFVERGGPTIIFADGGTGKSFVAMAIAITAASSASVIGQRHGDPVPVLFLDYETGPDTFDERLTGFLRGARIAERPPIFYRHMTASLSEAAATVRREITKLGIGFVIVDALGAARAGEPESADMTIRLFNAGRSLGVPWLGIDHVTKASGNDSTRPFGSTYTHNLARLTWGMDKAQEEGDNASVVALTNHKNNNGRRLARLGFRLEFENTAQDELLAVRVRSTDLMSVPDLAKKFPLAKQIVAWLRSGPVERSVLAEASGVDARQFSARVSDLKKAGVILELDGRLALKARTG